MKKKKNKKCSCGSLNHRANNCPFKPTKPGEWGMLLKIPDWIRPIEKADKYMKENFGSREAETWV